jgi:hypothetical protein
MRRSRRLGPLPLLALAVVVAAGAAPRVAGAQVAEPRTGETEPADPIALEPATSLDPARRARLETWWRHLGTAGPILDTAVRHLRRELLAWRQRPAHPGCQRARRVLAGVDRGALTRAADFRLTMGMARVLEELDGAAAACLERRYFELDYRLQVAEAELTKARQLARAQLARPRAP